MIADRRQGQERALVADVDREQHDREDADDEAGTIGTLPRPDTRATCGPNGQAVVARHREHHADARRVHRQAADGDRDRRVDEEDVADGARRAPA